MTLRILLIEDNPGDTLIFREKLNEGDLGNHEVTLATRLSEARQLLADNDDFDIIFCDLSLPDAGGVEAVREVSSIAPSVPLLVLTGLDDADTAARARDAGALDYLVKWYQDGPGMARYIRYAMAHRSGQRENQVDVAPTEEEPTEEEPTEEAPPPPDPVPESVRPNAMTEDEDEVEDEEGNEDGASDPLLHATRAALSFSRQTERRSRWMSEVLSVAIELENLQRRGVEAQRTMVDLRERLHHAVRETRSLAMKVGVPVRTTSKREKVPIVTDRNLVDILLRRLIVDAVLTAQGGYVRIDLHVDGSECEIQVTWPSDEEDWLSRSVEARALARSVLLRLASRMRGRCEIGKDGPRERVQVWLPREKAE